MIYESIGVITAVIVILNTNFPISWMDYVWCALMGFMWPLYWASVLLRKIDKNGSYFDAHR